MTASDPPGLTMLPVAAPVDAADLLPLYAVPRGRSLVRMMFVASLDGAAEIGGTSAGLGGAMDRQLIGMLRAAADGVLVGAGTLRRENYRAVRPLSARREWRLSAGFAEYPRLVVVSGSLPAADGKCNLYCAVIVKQVDAKTRAKTSINDLLRSD